MEFAIPTTALADAKFGSPNWSLKVDAIVDGKPFEVVSGLRVYAGSREEDEVDEDAVTAEPDSAGRSESGRLRQ